MGYTTPKTWSSGEVVTAALMNTHVRDNFNDLSQLARTWTAVQTFSAVPVFQDDISIAFGTGSDAAIRWSDADADNHALTIGLGDSNQALHITDLNAIAVDWDIAATTHPNVYIHSNTTPATDFLRLGNHTGTEADIDVFGGTTLNLKIAGNTEVSLTASKLDVASGTQLDASDATTSSSTTTGAIITAGGIGVAKDVTIGEDLNVVGVVGIGPLGSPETSNVLNIGKDFGEVDGSIYGIVGYYTASETDGATSNLLVGTHSDVRLGGSGQTANNDQNWTADVGLRSFMAQFQTRNGSTGRVTGGAGYYYANAAIGTGAVDLTNQYGIYMESLSGADNNYAIKTAGAGIVDIGDTTNSTGPTTGSINTSGGLGVALDTWLGGDLNAHAAAYEMNFRMSDNSTTPVFLRLMHSRGSVSSPATSQQNDNLGRLEFGGYADAWRVGAAINGEAMENWNGTSAGTQLVFMTTDKTTLVLDARMYLDENGGLWMAGATGNSKGAGTFNATAIYDDNTQLTDYVFEDEYKSQIATIPEMRDFFETNRHLPTIPGRDEWESDGSFSVGKISTHMWETAEVHAIYIAQLEERLRELEAKVGG